MRLARYSATAKYVPGKYLVVADTLSRLISPEPQQENNVLDEKVEAYVCNVLSNVPVSEPFIQRLIRMVGITTMMIAMLMKRLRVIYQYQAKDCFCFRAD